MRQTELVLTDEDRVQIGDICSKGTRQVREVNRAHVLSALDRKASEASIMQVLGVGRKLIWRTRAAYLDGGLDLALTDLPRPGKPLSHQTLAQSDVVRGKVDPRVPQPHVCAARFVRQAFAAR